MKREKLKSIERKKGIKNHLRVQKMDPNVIIRMKSGSVLYGTNILGSDLDIKGVFTQDPLGRDVIRSRYEKNGIIVDEELFSLTKFFALLKEGQTIALDMLFTPKEFYLENPSVVWDKIISERHNLFSNIVSPFIGYSLNQLNRFKKKGERISKIKNILEVLGKLPADKRLIESEDCLVNAGIEIREFGSSRFMMVLEKRIPLNVKSKYAIETINLSLLKYGRRSFLASEKNNVDYKTLMHAHRVASEGIELLESENITFPRPDRSHLLEIRLGKVDPEKEIIKINEMVDKLRSLERLFKLKDQDQEIVKEILNLNRQSLV